MDAASPSAPGGFGAGAGISPSGGGSVTAPAVFRFAVIVFLLFCNTVGAQQIKIQDFRKGDKSALSGVAWIPKYAVIDFETDQSGFAFSLYDGTQLEAEELQGFARVRIPRGTESVKIVHPDYGECHWKIPSKIQSKKYYLAFIFTYSINKELKASRQWLVLNTSPERSIVTVDGKMYRVNDGKAKFYLPVGGHAYTVSSPFHTSVSDSVTLDEKGRCELNVILEPFYSYITVRNALLGAVVYFDGDSCGTAPLTSPRLSPGNHRITLRCNYACLLDTIVCLEAAHKKVVDFSSSSYSPGVWDETLWMTKKGSSLQKSDSLSAIAEPSSEKICARVSITAPVDSAVILINREPVAKGSWSGYLPVGFYAIATCCAGRESATRYVDISDDSPKEFILGTVDDGYGMFNIDCNELNAFVYIDGVLCGRTPCMVENLIATRAYNVTLRKDGFSPVTRYVTARGNYIMDVKFVLKRK